MDGLRSIIWDCGRYNTRPHWPILHRSKIYGARSKNKTLIPACMSPLPRGSPLMLQPAMSFLLLFQLRCLMRWSPTRITEGLDSRNWEIGNEGLD